MKSINSIKHSWLMLCGAVVLLCGAAPKAIAQTVWTTCTWDTSSIYKQKDGKEKFERRFYATDLIATTKEVYVALTKGVPGTTTVDGDSQDLSGGTLTVKSTAGFGSTGTAPVEGRSTTS